MPLTVAHQSSPPGRAERNPGKPQPPWRRRRAQRLGKRAGWTSARAFFRPWGNLQHDWPKTKVKGGWGRFTGNKVKKKAARIDARPVPAYAPFCRVADRRLRRSNALTDRLPPPIVGAPLRICASHAFSPWRRRSDRPLFRAARRRGGFGAERRRGADPRPPAPISSSPSTR